MYAAQSSLRVEKLPPSALLRHGFAPKRQGRARNNTTLVAVSTNGRQAGKRGGKRGARQGSEAARQGREAAAAHEEAARWMTRRIAPPSTCAQAVQQARQSLRLAREDTQYEEDTSTRTPRRITIELPIPTPGRDDVIPPDRNYDWPGGMRQRFRYLRPLVDDLLEGYDAKFLGMLESESDGIGVWSSDRGQFTLVTLVSDVTFASFARLCRGEAVSRVLDPNHAIVVVNPGWTTWTNVGNFWERGLKDEAKRLIDDTDWLCVYSLRAVQTNRGVHGLLRRQHPGLWELFPAEEDPDGGIVPDEGVMPIVQRTNSRPKEKEMVAALRAHATGYKVDVTKEGDE